eukprot:gene6816-8144_t
MDLEGLRAASPPLPTHGIVWWTADKSWNILEWGHLGGVPRGVLLERVRKSCEMCMTYMRQMLGAYRGHLIEAVLHAEASQAEAKRLQDVEAELQSQQKRNNELDARMQALQLQESQTAGSKGGASNAAEEEAAAGASQLNRVLDACTRESVNDGGSVYLAYENVPPFVWQFQPPSSGSAGEEAKELPDVVPLSMSIGKLGSSINIAGVGEYFNTNGTKPHVLMLKLQRNSLSVQLEESFDIGISTSVIALQNESAEKAALLLHDLPLHNLTTVFTRLPAFNISKLLLAQENPGYFPDALATVVKTDPNTITLALAMVAAQKPTIFNKLINRMGMDCMEELCVGLKSVTSGQFQVFLDNIINSEFRCAEASAWREGISRGNDEMEDLYKNAVREGKIKDDMIKEYKERADWTEQRNSALQRQVTMMESEVKEMEMRMKMAEEDVLQSTNNQNRRAEALQGALHDDAKELEEVKLRMQEMEKESEQPWSLITLLVSEDDLGSREKIGT